MKYEIYFIHIYNLQCTIYVNIYNYIHVQSRVRYTSICDRYIKLSHHIEYN